jgi:hypothetical protein
MYFLRPKKNDVLRFVVRISNNVKDTCTFSYFNLHVGNEGKKRPFNSACIIETGKMPLPPPPTCRRRLRSTHRRRLPCAKPRPRRPLAHPASCAAPRSTRQAPSPTGRGSSPTTCLRRRDMVNQASPTSRWCRLPQIRRSCGRILSLPSRIRLDFVRISGVPRTPRLCGGE